MLPLTNSNILCGVHMTRGKFTEYSKAICGNLKNNSVCFSIALISSPIVLAVAMVSLLQREFPPLEQVAQVKTELLAPMGSGHECLDVSVGCGSSPNHGRLGFSIGYHPSVPTAQNDLASWHPPIWMFGPILK